MTPWWTLPEKHHVRNLALFGGISALAGLFIDDTILVRLALFLIGLGVFVGSGAYYCLLDRPEEKDIILLKVVSRLGFLLIGPGMGIFIWNYKSYGAGKYMWLVYAVTAVPLISLIRLLWTYWKKRSGSKDKEPRK